MSRFTPCRCIAAMMLVAPCEYTVIGLRLYDTPSADSTASLPAMVASTASASATSAPTTLSHSRGGMLAGRRLTAVTWWPAPRACSTSLRPVPPLAPKTVSRITSSK
jgi:hypothetical protein